MLELVLLLWQVEPLVDAAALATSGKHLDNNLKSELYEAGRSKGLAGSSQTGHADSTLDSKLQTTAMMPVKPRVEHNWIN